MCDLSAMAFTWGFLNDLGDHTASRCGVYPSPSVAATAHPQLHLLDAGGEVPCSEHGKILCCQLVPPPRLTRDRPGLTLCLVSGNPGCPQVSGALRIQARQARWSRLPGPQVDSGHSKELRSPLSVGRTHSARPRTRAVTPSRSPYRTAALP